MSVSPSEMTVIGQFSVQYTFFIFMWNQAEATARRILQLMLGESDVAMALSVELGNRSLTNAIRTGARDPQFAKVRDELEHLIVGYDRLLAYRNYHVHSLLGIDSAGGILLSVSAKGQLKMSRDRSTMPEIESLKQSVSAWIGFAAAIEKALGASGDGLESLIEAYSASLEKPTWPAPLTKNTVLLQSLQPPPESSPQ